jgi:hypothetical protein
VLRPDGTAYRPEETALIRQLTGTVVVVQAGAR